MFGSSEGDGDSGTEEKTELRPVEPPETTNDAVFLTPLVNENDNSNRALEEDEYDYDHGPINKAEFLTGWGG